MIKIKTLLATGLLIGNIIFVEPAAGQAPGSSSVYMGLAVTTGGTQADISESLYLGPGTYQIDGTWEIYAKYVYVSPDAVINGNGTIQFYNPSDAGGIASATYIDGNDAPFQVNLELHNADNLVLANIPDPGFDDGPSVVDNASLNVHKDFNLAVDNGDVIMGRVFDDGTAGNTSASITDFIFGSDNASITNYGADRMVVTSNSIQGHMVKVLNEGPNMSFTFPVGIAEGDYTPVTLGYSGIVTYHVSVTDYAASTAQIDRPEEGMDRAWHIYGGFAQNMVLQHNNATDGTDYTDSDAFITQYQGGGAWSTSTATDYVSAGIHANQVFAQSDIIGVGIQLTATDYAWYTKASDPDTPLPVRFVSFDAHREGNAVKLVWITASESNNKGFDIERSPEGRNWTHIGSLSSKAENGNTNSKQEYSFSDEVPLPGVNYYRLKQSDFDGKYLYSRIREVRFNTPNNVYPNPASETVNIAGLSGTEEIKVFSLAGRVVLQTTARGTTEHISLDKLVNGIYLVQVTTSQGIVTTYKVVKNN